MTRETSLASDADAQFQPVLGSYLGDFTSELKDEEYIEEFVSGGPKNYGYEKTANSCDSVIRIPVWDLCYVPKT